MQKSTIRCAKLARYITGVLTAITVVCVPVIAAQAKPRGIPSVLPVAADVDLNRYSGKWFEIVNPTWSASATCNDAVDTYTVDSSDSNNTTRLTAVHSCTRAGMLIHRADGTLYAPNADAPARLILEAKSTLGRASYTRYDIVDLDPDYQWAVVGDDNRRYIWVLSRTPEMDTKTLQDIFKRLNESAGYRNVQKSSRCVPQSEANTQNCKSALSL
jgi:apolipoprotein D and lipocalin family protein